MSALTGNRDEFAVGAAGRRRDSTRHFIRIDAAVTRGLREFAGLAIGPGGMGTALLALGEAFVDTIAIGLIGNDENAAVRKGFRRNNHANAGNQCEQKCI